jgi:hypothetical protein
MRRAERKVLMIERAQRLVFCEQSVSFVRS